MVQQHKYQHQPHPMRVCVRALKDRLRIAQRTATAGGQDNRVFLSSYFHLLAPSRALEWPVPSTPWAAKLLHTGCGRGVQVRPRHVCRG